MADTVTIQVQDSVGAIALATFTIPIEGVAATPTFSPGGGTYSSPQSVTIASQAGATIYYTTNGTTPTTSSPVYSSPITVSASETVQAIATAPGYLQSAVGSAVYTISSGSFAFVSPSTLPAATNGGSYFYQLSTSGGTGAVTYAFKYTTTANISNMPIGSSAMPITLTTSATPFAGFSQAFISGYGSQGAGSTSPSGNYNSLTVLITGVSGDVVNTAYNSNNQFETGTGGTLSAGAATGQTTWTLSPSGYLYAAPVVNETATVTITATDSASHTATQTFTIVVNSTLAVMGTSLDRSVQPLPSGRSGNKYGSAVAAVAFQAAGGTGTGYTWSVTNLPPGLSMSGANIIGTPTTAGTYTGIVATVTDSGSNQASATFSMTIASAANGTRPSYNSNAANGLYVLNGNLYGPDNGLLQLRGMDRNHFNEGTQASWSLSHASVVRFVLYNQLPENTQNTVVAAHIAAGQVPVVVRFGNNTTPPAQTGNSTGSSSLPLLGAMTTDWCNNFSLWSPYQAQMMLNVANEWGPTNSINWQTAYVYEAFPIASIAGTTITLASSVGGSTNPAAGPAALTYAYMSGATGISAQAFGISATTGGVSGAWTVTTTASLGTGTGGTLYMGSIGMLRGVGYTCPIVIDTGNFGEDINDFVNFGPAVFSSDPLKNVVFSFHFYGLGNSYPPGSTPTQLATIVGQLVSLRTSTGAVVAILEFGNSTPPGASIAAPTELTPGQIITACETNSIHWAEWAFDDNNLSNGATTPRYFGLTATAGIFTKPSDLTPQGLDVILNPTYGVRALASPASYLL